MHHTSQAAPRLPYTLSATAALAVGLLTLTGCAGGTGASDAPSAGTPTTTAASSTSTGSPSASPTEGSGSPSASGTEGTAVRADGLSHGHGSGDRHGGGASRPAPDRPRL